MTLAISEGVEQDDSGVSRSSFYLAMRIMPARQRLGMFEIYAFCRAVDDIADNGGPREIQIARLQKWRDDIDKIYRGSPPPRRLALARAVADFGLRRDDFLAVIDGMEMDVLSTVTAPDWATLDLYCDRVASAVGRLSVRVFGMDEAPGIALAHHLGRALQLTNILRDIDEDAAIDRLYLPREALLRAGATDLAPSSAIAHPAIGKVCELVSARAEAHFAEAYMILAKTPRAAARTPRIMAEAYRLILSRLIARGWSAPRASVKPGKSRYLWIVLRCLLW
jgi:phytoene synthase